MYKTHVQRRTKLKHNGKIKQPEQKNRVEMKAKDVPRSNYNPRECSNIETLKRMEKIVDALKDINPPEEGIAYNLLNELDSLLFTLVDEGAKVPEILIDGCIDRKELTNERS